MTVETKPKPDARPVRLGSRALSVHSSLPRTARPVLLAGAVALPLCALFVFAMPLLGTDLAAQVARGHFLKNYGWGPVDFRWYGGVSQPGYSLISPLSTALLGSRGTGAVSAVVGALAFAYLLVRCDAPKPAFGGALGALGQVLNLMSGRITFALGLALGLLATAAYATPQLRRFRLPLAGALAALATAGSPIAGLFIGLAAVALMITRRWDAWSLGVGAAVPMGLIVMFSDGGQQPFARVAVIAALAECVLVIVLVPATYRVVRVATALSAFGVLAAYFVPTPVGSNSVRLVMVFGPALVGALARPRWFGVAFILVALYWWEAPGLLADLTDADHAASTHRPFYTPLIDELHKRGPIGRIEVVPLRDHWESTYIAEAVPIARGWERQVDTERNPIFYDGTLDATTYRQWLDDNAVSYVAISDTQLDPYARDEADLIHQRLPYLVPRWAGGHWTLYEVLNSSPLVDGATLVSSGATGVVLKVTKVRPVVVRVRWSRWLTVEGPDSDSPDGCLAPSGEWTELYPTATGQYTITSALNVNDSASCANNPPGD
jgi:hypothetical protein